MKTVISFATAWGAQWGGINAFNADLLSALAIAFPHNVRVVCVVLNAEDSDCINAKKQNGVEIISLARPNDTAMSDDLESNAWSELQRLEPRLQIDTDTIWLGHDRITGGIAERAKQNRGGRFALIHHMSYEHYESYAENSTTAQDKFQEQKKLFKLADLRLAVGPLLGDALCDMLDAESVPVLIPGLAEIDPRKNTPKKFQVFLSGRLNTDNQKIKQATLGLAGFAHAVKKCDEDTAYPNLLRSQSEPQLKLRGLSWDENNPNIENDAILARRFWFGGMGGHCRGYPIGFK
jgi:hypothetical protein